MSGTLRDGQGQSSMTVFKQRRFERFLWQHMRMVKGILSRHTAMWQYYLYIDLNAGSGYNEEAGCEGSPMIACRVARELDLPLYGLFFERNKEAASELEERLGEYRGKCTHLNVWACDHNDKLGQVLTSFRGSGRYGLVYHDPNGAEVPTEAYTQFANRLPKVDALMNINATVRKRMRGQNEESRKKYDADFLVPLDECLTAIPKKHCFVTSPMGKHQWVMAALTNYMPSGMPAEWHDILTLEGRRALDMATFTSEEFALKVYEQTKFNF